MSKEFLKNVKNGDVLVRKLTGGGFTTESIVEIESVRENGIFIDGADGDYENDSTYRFNKTTGKSVNNYTPGFYSTLDRIASEEDLQNLQD